MPIKKLGSPGLNGHDHIESDRLGNPNDQEGRQRGFNPMKTFMVKAVLLSFVAVATIPKVAVALDIKVPTVQMPHISPPHVNTPTVHLNTPQINSVTGHISTGNPGTLSPGVKVITGGSPNGTGTPGVVITKGPVTGPLTPTNNPPANLLPPGAVEAAAVAAAALAQQQQQVGIAIAIANATAGPPILRNVPPFQFGYASAPTYDPPCPLGAGGAQCITIGGDNSTYAAVIGALQAAVASANTALMQGQDLAAACGVDPSGAGCSSAPSLQQLQQNLANAQTALQSYEYSIDALLWLLSEIEGGFPVPAGDAGPAEAAIAAALTACLANPSSCAADIAQLQTVLSALGISTQGVAQPVYEGMCWWGCSASLPPQGIPLVTLSSANGSTWSSITVPPSGGSPPSLSEQLAVDVAALAIGSLF
jgi:hypothetical protein